jgi:hypothetical protein
MGEGQQKITPSNPTIQFAFNICINHNTAQVSMVNETSCTDSHKAVKLKRIVTIFSWHHSFHTFTYAGGSSAFKTMPSEE